jgi:hypothetical protein
LDSDFAWPAEDSGPPYTAFQFSSDEEDSDLAQYDGRSDASDDDPPPDENLEVDVEDIASDPLFRSRASLFDEVQRTQITDDEEESIPSAFDDHPAIRNAYIRVFLGAAFGGMTRETVKLMLNGYKIAFEASDVAMEGLSNFALTLPTVEKRLGVGTADLITYYCLCNGCWTPHSLQELSQLDSPACTEPECSGKLYTIKRLVDGDKRTPTLMLPFVAPEKALQRMCLQPGKVDQWQEWRNPDDAPGPREPSALKGYDAFPDLDKPMTNITDGWGWRAVQAGLQRRRNGKWEIQDVDVHEINQQFVAMPNGLILQMNIDW